MTQKNEASDQNITGPQVDNRLGLLSPWRGLSKNVVRLSMAAAALVVVGTFFVSEPSEPPQTAHGISPPRDGIQVIPQIPSYSVDSDRDTSARQRLSGQRRKLPGLQKIDRKRVDRIPPGSSMSARLETAASDGPVTAEITEPLSVQGEVIIPEGTKILGVGQTSDDRLLIHFNQLVFRDGSFEQTAFEAAESADKTIGLKGSFFGRLGTKYATAVGLNFVGGMAEGLEEREFVNQQVIKKTDARNALLAGVSKATLELGKDLVTGIKNKPPRVEIEAKKEITLVFVGNETR